MNGRTFSLILASAEKEKKNDQQERKLRPAGPCTDVDVADFFPVGGRQVDEEAEGGRLSVVVEGGDQQLVALHCPVRVCTHTVSHHALSTLHRPVRVCTHTVSHHALSNLHRQQVEWYLLTTSPRRRSYLGVTHRKHRKLKSRLPFLLLIKGSKERFLIGQNKTGCKFSRKSSFPKLCSIQKQTNN